MGLHVTSNFVGNQVIRDQISNKRAFNPSEIINCTSCLTAFLVLYKKKELSHQVNLILLPKTFLNYECHLASMRGIIIIYIVVSPWDSNIPQRHRSNTQGKMLSKPKELEEMGEGGKRGRLQLLHGS